MKRRKFMTLLAGAAAIWPVAARGQPGERMRRVGVLSPWPANDKEAQDRVDAFTQGLEQLGWRNGTNVRIDYRPSDGAPEIRSDNP